MHAAANTSRSQYKKPSRIQRHGRATGPARLPHRRSVACWRDARTSIAWPDAHLTRKAC